MKLIDLLELENKTQLNAAREISCETDDGYYVELWWHQPSLNLAWYPILQIDDSNYRTVFHAEGPENSCRWNAVLERAILLFKEG